MPTNCRVFAHAFNIEEQRDRHYDKIEESFYLCDEQPCPHRLNQVPAHLPEGQTLLDFGQIPIEDRLQHPVHCNFVSAILLELPPSLPITRAPTPMSNPPNPAAHAAAAAVPIAGTGTLTLTMDQLNDIIRNAVLAATSAAPATTTMVTHDKPGKYKGEKEHDLERFIS